MRQAIVADAAHRPIAYLPIAPDPQLASERIGRQLNLGVSGIVFVGVESADEVKAGLAAMRFKSKGGSRLDDVGAAPAYWGMSEAEYRAKADVWPLNPNGELVSWAIVNVPCGYPANAGDIETRMTQGFSVFVINWGEPGFKAVEIGRKHAGR